ncbi:MAG: hypothetical protein SPI25_05940 [Dialister sp.]|nr:hypothetical protein [Dialister sp.]
MDTLLRFPIRYYSIVTVPKDFVAEAVGEGSKDRESSDVTALLKDLAKRHATYAAVTNSLTPYLFLLLEVDHGGAYWQYIDLAGSLAMIKYTDEDSYVLAEKKTVQGGIMYQMRQVYLKRTAERSSL